MIVINTNISAGGKVQYVVLDPVDQKAGEGVTITFSLYGNVEKRKQFRKFENLINSSDIDWLHFDRDECLINLGKLRGGYELQGEAGKMVVKKFFEALFVKYLNSQQ